MKNLYTFLLVMLTVATAQSQTFDFSLMYMGINETTDNHQVALLATPSSSVTDGNTADMGAGFYLPSGLTIGNFETGNSGLPASEWTSQTLGTSNANGDPYFVSRIEAGSSSILLNGDGPFELVIFDVLADPNPTSGELKFVENGDPVFDEILFIENYMNINLGSGPVNAYLQNDPTANSINFESLSVSEQVLNDSSIYVYPNPTSEFINISTRHSILYIEMFDILGKKVKYAKNENQINVSDLKTGLYIFKVFTNQGEITKKIVIE